MLTPFLTTPFDYSLEPHSWLLQKSPCRGQTPRVSRDYTTTQQELHNLLLLITLQRKTFTQFSTKRVNKKCTTSK